MRYTDPEYAMYHSYYILLLAYLPPLLELCIHSTLLHHFNFAVSLGNICCTRFVTANVSICMYVIKMK